MGRKIRAIFVGLGSNLGNRKSNLKKALIELKKSFSLIKVSSVYETEKWGNAKGNDFLNCVCELETKLAAKTVLKKLLEIEKKMGRKRIEIEKGKKKEIEKKIENGKKFEGKIYSPRIIDLDLLFYGTEIINEKNLIVPHPLLHERNFVLIPLNEIASDFIHPVLKKSIKILAKLTKDGKMVSEIFKPKISF